MRVIDTTVAIDHLRGDEVATQHLRQAIDEDGMVLASELVRFELLAGVRDEEQTALEDFMSALTWIAVDEQVSRTAGALARDYLKTHPGISDADYLIAATALLLDAELLTTNVRHFPMFPGLQPPY